MENHFVKLLLVINMGSRPGDVSLRINNPGDQDVTYVLHLAYLSAANPADIWLTSHGVSQLCSLLSKAFCYTSEANLARHVGDSLVYEGCALSHGNYFFLFGKTDRS